MAKSNQIVHPDSEFFGLDPSKMPEPPVDLTVDTKGDKEQDTGHKGPSQEEFLALQARLNDLATTNQTLLQAMTQARAPQQQFQPQPVTIDIEGLPDPTDDVKGFLEGLTGRLGSTVTQVRDDATRAALLAQQHATDVQTTINDAWGDLQKRYVDVAPHVEIVETATGRVVAGLQQRGVDPAQYMRANLNQFVDSVAQQARGIIQKIKGLDENNNPIEDNGRALEMLGGQASGTSRGTQKTHPKDEPNPRFTDEVKAVQKKLGLF